MRNYTIRFHTDLCCKQPKPHTPLGCLTFFGAPSIDIVEKIALQLAKEYKTCVYVNWIEGREMEFVVNNLTLEITKGERK